MLSRVLRLLPIGMVLRGVYFLKGSNMLAFHLFHLFSCGLQGYRLWQHMHGSS